MLVVGSWRQFFCVMSVNRLLLLNLYCSTTHGLLYIENNFNAKPEFYLCLLISKSSLEICLRFGRNIFGGSIRSAGPLLDHTGLEQTLSVLE